MRIARTKHVGPAADRRVHNEIVVRIIRHHSINTGGFHNLRHSGKTVHVPLNPLFAQTPARLDARVGKNARHLSENERGNDQAMRSLQDVSKQPTGEPVGFPSSTHKDITVEDDAHYDRR